MTAHLDKNERAIRPGAPARVEGTVERVDGNGAFIRVNAGLVIYVPLLAVEVKE